MRVSEPAGQQAGEGKLAIYSLFHSSAHIHNFFF